MNRRRPSRRGATLVELTAGLAITAILIGGLMSAITLASRAVPDPEDPLAASIDGFHAAEQIAADLYCAQSFSNATATAVQFTVVDRDNDSTPETIRYEWSGTPGDPLRWQYNSSPEVQLVREVYEFDLAYAGKTKSTTEIQETTIKSDEIVLASFDGWSGIAATSQQVFANSSCTVSEYFVFMPPEGTTSLTFTRAMVRASSAGTAPPSFTVGIHRSLNDGSYLAESAPIGTPATIPGAVLSTLPNWIPSTFTDVVVNDPARGDYCLVVAGQYTTPVYTDYYYSRKAPVDSTVMRWTTDGGASWNPSKDFQENDLRFHVYGTYETTTTEEVTVERVVLKSIRLALRTGESSATRVVTSISILNAPEVMP